MDTLDIVRVNVCTCDVLNRRNRIYTADVLKHAINRPEIQQQLKSGGIFGFLYTREDPDDNREIPLSEVSHATIGFDFEGDNLFATIAILDTPRGRKLAKLNKASKAYFFISGLGCIDSENVVYDYDLDRIDAQFINFDIGEVD